jgi:AraC family transcriptional regulator
MAACTATTIVTPRAAGFSKILAQPPLLSSEPLGWSGLVVEQHHYPPGELHSPRLSDHVAALYLGQPLSSVRWQDDVVHRGPTLKGNVTLKVAGQAAGWRWDKAADILHLCLRPDFLRRVAEENDLDADRGELLGSFDETDPRIEHIGLALHAELRSGAPNGRVYGEALATALAAHLLQEHSSRPQTIRDFGSGLPESALRRLSDYVGDNLHRNLTLSEMAGVEHLSTYHFSRMFKRSTGFSPYRYVIQRRVERAEELLSGTDLTVAEVAHAVGFSHQSHLAYHTRRLLGVSPTSLRR